MVHVHDVDLAAGVAPVGVGGEIRESQADIGLVRSLGQALVFEGQGLGPGGARRGAQAEADDGVIDVEAGGAAVVEPFETVRLFVQQFDLAADLPVVPRRHPAAHGAMRADRAEVSAEQDDPHGQSLVRAAADRGGGEIDGAARGQGTVFDRPGAFGDLDAGHAGEAREIVGGGGGVGRRGDEDAVLHQGDPRRAIGSGAADADIGTQAEAVLLLEHHAGGLAQDAVDVGKGEGLQRRLVQRGGRTASGPGLGAGADDYDRAQDGRVFRRRIRRRDVRRLPGQGR